MVRFITIILVGAAAAMLFLAVITVIQKYRRAAEVALRQRIEARFRPALVGLLAEDDPDLDELLSEDSVGGQTGVVVDGLAESLMSKLRGADRDVLRGLLEQRGAFDRARRDTSSSNPTRRMRAVEFLGHGEMDSANDEMEKLLEDRDLAVRKAAVRAIGKLGNPESVSVLMETLVKGRAPMTIVGMAILHIGSAASERLIASLVADHPMERRLAAECLGILGVIGAVGGLLERVECEEQPECAQAAIRALGRIGSPTAAPALTEAMAESTSAITRAEAATALGRIGGEAAVLELETAANGPDLEVVRAATQAIRWAGGAGVALLGELAMRPDLVGAHAREALGGVGARSEAITPA